LTVAILDDPETDRPAARQPHTAAHRRRRDRLVVDVRLGAEVAWLDAEREASEILRDRP
jgi:hypothetical protein